MRFEFYRLRFRFQAAGPVYFPPGKSANLVRGAFGSAFRKMACVPGCEDARTCAVRASCPYARIFEPRAARGAGPSGLADWPRPFVFRASHLDGLTVPAGAEFCFGVHLFDVRDPAAPYFIRAFAQVGREGIGPTGGCAELASVEQLSLRGAVLRRIFDGSNLRDLAPPAAVDLDAAPGPVPRVRVLFLTPTELKQEQRLAEKPEFAVLFARIRDRLSTLRSLYGAGPLEVDFRRMGHRAAQVRMTRCEIEHCHGERRSGRTGQVHPLGGFTGLAEYEGDLAEFLPYLEAARWTGVGRQTVWGKGEIAIRNSAS